MSRTNPPELMLSIACNHWRNGSFLGRFDHAEIHPQEHETLLRLYGPDTTVRFLDGHRIRIGRIAVPYRSHIEWYGNWCWDSVGVDPTSAVKVLRYLKRRGFDCEEGESTLFNRWRKSEPINMDDLKRSLSAFREESPS